MPLEEMSGDEMDKFGVLVDDILQVTLEAAEDAGVDTGNLDYVAQVIHIVSGQMFLMNLGMVSKNFGPQFAKENLEALLKSMALNFESMEIPLELSYTIKVRPLPDGDDDGHAD